MFIIHCLQIPLPELRPDDAEARTEWWRSVVGDNALGVTFEAPRNRVREGLPPRRRAPTRDNVPSQTMAGDDPVTARTTRRMRPSLRSDQVDDAPVYDPVPISIARPGAGKRPYRPTSSSSTSSSHGTARPTQSASRSHQQPTETPTSALTDVDREWVRSELARGFRDQRKWLARKMKKWIDAIKCSSPKTAAATAPRSRSRTPRPPSPPPSPPQFQHESPPPSAVHDFGPGSSQAQPHRHSVQEHGHSPAFDDVPFQQPRYSMPEIPTCEPAVQMSEAEGFVHGLFEQVLL